jgi:tryptophanyl-tRNA synthetase
MSKSYNNFINIFLPEKELKKVVMGIVTDSTPLEQPKNPDTCNAFKLYALLANEADTKQMRVNYSKGGYGYGQAKTALFELILDKFKNERTEFNRYMSEKTELDKKLLLGAEKARKIAQPVLERVREKLGY